MLASHPLDSLFQRTLWIIFVALLVLTIAISLLFHVWGQVLVHEEAVFGILSFEFVWNPAGVARVMGPWSEAARQTAFHINLVDFIYMAVYSTALTAAALLIRRKAFRLGLKQLAKVALLVAWFSWFAAGFDAIENLASFPLLLGEPHMPWPLVMSIAAGIKFLILFEIIIFLIFISFFLIALARKVR